MFYTIQGNDILIANNEEALSKYYSNVLPLPIDYEAGKYVVQNGELVLDPDYEVKQKQAERERIAKLSLTKREVFLGLYQAKQITPDMIKTQITDPAVLIEFEYANYYYRGNPLIDVIGNTLGITSEQLDRFFETNDYTTLLPQEI